MGYSMLKQFRLSRKNLVIVSVITFILMLQKEAWLAYSIFQDNKTFDEIVMSVVKKDMESEDRVIAVLNWVYLHSEMLAKTHKTEPYHNAGRPHGTT